MTIKNTGGPAFPVSNDADKQYIWIKKGMTLRDYFAAKAMQGLLACNATYGGKESKTDLTKDAYAHADAMLEARENT